MNLFVISSLFFLTLVEGSTNDTDLKSERCDHEYEYFNDNCYYFSCRQCKKNFYDAKEFCERYGGNLVSIHDGKENDFLIKHSNNFITGLQYAETDKKFFWTDNTNVNFDKLPKSFVNKCGHFGRCVRIKDNKWENAGCNRQFRWICQKKPLVMASVCPEENSEPLLDGGVLKSPGYPAKYSVGTSTCYYNLIVRVDELITIVFNETDLYYDPISSTFDHDEIEVYEGFEEDARLIGRVTGASVRGTTFETESLNEMTLRFRSGSGLNRTGKWMATWFAKPNKRLRYAEAYRKFLLKDKHEFPRLSSALHITTTTPLIAASVDESNASFLGFSE